MATIPDSFHPSFSDKTADVALHSVEGTVYLVHSIILRNTSSFFRTMLSLPQPADSKVPHEIPVGEKDVVLERVLRLMCGMEIPRWSSLDEIESVLTLIEKWDAPGPLSVVRTAITSTQFTDEPLRLYVLTSHLGWEEESKQVLTETLKLTLLSGDHEELLCRLSSKSLLKIVTFHDRCKTRFRDALNGGELFSAGNEEQRICGCGKRTDNTTWRALKAKLVTEFEKRPLGDQILINMSAWPEAAACWREKCGCGTQYYDQVATVRNIKQSITNAISLSLAG